MKVSVGSYEILFFQMKPNLVAYLECVWNPMLIITFLVLAIIFLQNIMDMLSNALNSFNEYGLFFILRVSMGRFYLCICKGESYINEA